MRRLGEAVLVLFVGWLYGGDLLRYASVQSAPAALVNELPPLALSVVGVLLGLWLVAALVLSLRKPQLERMHGLALASVWALLFVDFALISSRRTPLLPEDQVALVVQQFADGVTAASSPEGVPTDRRGLAMMAEELSRPPVYRAGVRPEKWAFDYREGCSGPATESGTAQAGTLVYCRSADGRQAWVTAVAAPLGKRFGPVGVVSNEGPFVGLVTVRAATADDETQAPPAVWEPPTP